MSEHRIDQLARTLACTATRRTFISRLGTVALATVGLAARQPHGVGAESEPLDERPDEVAEEQQEHQIESEPEQQEQSAEQPEHQLEFQEPQAELTLELLDEQDGQDGQDEQPANRQQLCRPHFVAGEIVLRAQEDADGKVLRTYGVGRVRCSCQGVCITEPPREEGRRRNPIREKCVVGTSPIRYSWSLEVLAPRDGDAPISIEGASDGEEVTLAWTGEGRARLSVTISGCECCCPETDDCTGAGTKERKLMVSARAQ